MFYRSQEYLDGRAVTLPRPGGFHWLCSITCTGTEDSLEGCSHSQWGHTESCQSDAVASIVCYSRTSMYFLLHKLTRSSI